MMMQKILTRYSHVFTNSDHVYLQWLPKIEVYLWVWESQTNYVLIHLAGLTIQDDVIANFHFQILGSY